MANNKYKALFTALLDEEGVRYAEQNDYVLEVIFEGENLPTVSIWLFFDENDAPMVEIKCWEIAHCPKEKRIAFLRTCNELNQKYRLVSFCIDEDDEILARLDHYIDEENCGELCFTLVAHMYQAVDDAYPSFMKILRGKRR